MKFYNEKGQVFEAASVKDLIANTDLKDVDRTAFRCCMKDLWCDMTLYYMRNEKYEPVEIHRLFIVLNPDAKSITDRYNKNGYSGNTSALKSADVAKIVKQILKKVGKENSEYCSAKFYNETIDMLKEGLRNKFKREQFLVRAKEFKSELNALLDKYGFEFEGRAESDYDTNSASAAVYVKEKEIVDSKRHSIEIMNFYDDSEIEFPEMEEGCVEQKSYN
jgi:hypothetical protein